MMISSCTLLLKAFKNKVGVRTKKLEFKSLCTDLPTILLLNRLDDSFLSSSLPAEEKKHKFEKKVTC